MKTIRKTLLATALFGGALLSASATAAQKIGAVNVQNIFQSMPQAAAIQQTIAEEFKDQTAAIKAMEEDLKYQVEKLQRESATMSAAQKKALEDKIIKQRQEYAAKAQPLQQQINQRAAEERNKVLSLIKQALDKVAAKENYDLVLNANAVAFAKEDADLTRKVLDQVSKAN